MYIDVNVCRVIYSCCVIHWQTFRQMSLLLGCCFH